MSRGEYRMEALARKRMGALRMRCGMIRGVARGGFTAAALKSAWRTAGLPKKANGLGGSC